MGRVVRKGPSSTKAVVDFWTVVMSDTGLPVLPFDCNPDSCDQGMLVYQSKSAAEKSAKHQRRMYWLKCKAARLDRVELPVV